MGRRLRIVTFKIYEDELDLIDRYAQTRGMSRSEVIREAIYKMISSGGPERDQALDIAVARREVLGGSGNGSRENRGVKKSRIELSI